ncbi:AraC family transcriptional regulator [Ruegeria lacuscaerulensis]|uniref:AraC family transcriptional regulator n=1 Tax=Ruegeria lacuscaerulensis TaxID=55218 RepID=UPI00148104D3|nr:AraC family transcriptional regulator [Ruegeria lacuscaerulensis]
MDASDRSREANYKGQLSYFGAPSGATFGFTRSDDTTTYFGQPTGDYLVLSSTISGAVRLETKDGDGQTVTAGSNLVVLDGSVPVSTRTRDHSHVYMTLPMELIRDQLGGEVRPAGRGVAQMAPNGLAPFLESQLHMMAKECTKLSEVETLHLIDSLQSLALGALSRLGSDPPPAGAPAQTHALHTAATRYIALNLGDENLRADSVADAIQCSRSSLFRAFQDHNDTFGNHIRRARFKLAKSYLVNQPDMPIQIVAHLCGYKTPESFGRFFREQAGMTASAYRDSGV